MIMLLCVLLYLSIGMLTYAFMDTNFYTLDRFIIVCLWPLVWLSAIIITVVALIAALFGMVDISFGDDDNK